MGVYLSNPIKEKISTYHENKFLKCGASSMQGWRMSQEDAHNCCLDFDSEVALFAVYDGHGGAEVAEYASQHLPRIIKESAAYKGKDLEKALQDAFLEFDATLVTESVLEELKKISGSKKSNNNVSETDDEDAEDDVQGLREEAHMPLADVIARYANGTLPKTPALKRIKGESSTKSPYLRARAPPSTSDTEVTSSGGSGVGSAAAGSSGDSAEVMTNGISEEDKPGKSAEPGTSEVSSNCEPCVGEASSDIKPGPSNGSLASNGDVPVESTSETPSSAKKSDDCDVVSSSSSSVNGESTSSVSSSGRLSARKARSNMYRSLLAAVAADAEDESDSEDNDESFSAVADSSTLHSSDEDEEVTGGEGEVEDEEDETEGEEEEEEEEDEEDEEDDENQAEIDLTDEETDEPGKGSGCTAVVALVTKDRVTVANAGDSRAVLSRQGEAVDLSIDHKPEDPIELSRITAAGGKVTPDGRVNGGLNLSRALGDHMYKKTANLPATEQMITALPDIKTVELKEGEDEFIVLACDGIWNSMSSQEVVDFIRPMISKGEPLVEICGKLFDNCLAEHTLGDGTGCDNMTCVIVQLFPHLNICSAKRKSEEGEEDDGNKRVKVDSEGGNT